MANRYWVGGAGTWDSSTTTNWSTTSGGAGGASAPTAVDIVFIDTSSGTGTITCTGALCGDLNFTATQAIVIGGTSLTISGSLDCFSSGSATITVTAITFNGGATGKTVNFGNKSLVASVVFNGVGGGWQLTTGNLTTTSTVTLTAGSLNTNGRSVSCSTFNISGTSTRSLSLGASAITISNAAGWVATTTTGLTFNAGTSTITMSSSSPQFAGGGLTYNNVTFSSTIGSILTVVTGANTFNTLTQTAPSTNLRRITFDSDQTITTMVMAGTTYGTRTFLASNAIGTPRTLTIGTWTTKNYLDFRDITIAGAVGTISGTSLGNCGGNTGITFTAAKTVYWNLAGSQNWNAVGWASSSGGSPSGTNFPLAQDTAVIDNAGSITALNINDVWNLCNIDMSGRTTGMTFNMITTAAIYGNFTLGSGIGFSGTSTLTFVGRSTQTITTAGKTFTFPITIDAPSSTVQLNGNYTSNLGVTTTAITLTKGTFDAVSYDVFISIFVSNNSNTRTLNMGSGTWTLYGTGTVWSTTTITGFTLNKDTSNILISNTTANKTISGGALSYPKISYYDAGYTLALSSAGTTYEELDNLANSSATTVTFPTSGTSTITTWNITGSAGILPIIKSSSTGTTATIAVTNKTTASVNYLDIRDISCSTLTPVTFYVGANSVNTSNNSGVAFVAPSSTEVQILTSGTSWTVPSGFGSSNTIHLFGGGGGGGGSRISGSNRAAGGGGGGGGYTQISNASLTPSSSIDIAIGAGGSAGTAGGNTTLNIDPITYIADAKTQNTSTGNSLVINKPTGTTTGDLLLAFITDNGFATTFTPPAGWSTGVATSQNRACFYKTAGASEASTYTFTSNTISGNMQGYILTYRNASFDVGGAVGAAGSPITDPSITLTSANNLVLAYFSVSAGTGTTYSTPTGFTAIDTDGDATAPSSAIFSKAFGVSGATGTVSSTISAGSGRGFLVGLSGSGFVYTAGGGSPGTATTTPTSAGGAGGTGTTFNGGTGGAGATSTASSGVVGGGGAGGAGGPNGVGKNGGTGRAGGATNEIGGGGGGGNGGGTNGGNASANLGGDGGNNSLGTGGAIGTSGNGASGTLGGGGAGAGGGSSTGGIGGSGIEILNSFGGAGGAGGTSIANALSNTGLYGGGGGGAGASGTTQRTGGNGSQGAIIIVYTSGGSFSESITESISAGDTNAVVLTLNATVTEDMSVASVESVLAAFFLNLTETITANDGQVANLATATSVTESFDISTLISGGIAANASVTENSGIAALNTEFVVFSGVVTENVGIADAMSVVGAFSTSIAEALGINDVRQANTAFPAVIVEAVTVNSTEDAATVFSTSIIENMTLNDVRVVGNAYFVSRVENSTPRSVQTGILTFLADVVENLESADDPTITAVFRVSIAEPTTIGDNTAVYGWFKINDDQTANWVVIGTTDTPNWVSVDNTQNGNWQNINNDQG